MAVTYAVDPTTLPDREGGSLEVSYGWAHYHAFIGLLAREEGIDLPSMRDYGGIESWSSADTVLRPLFDMASLADDRLPAETCAQMRPRLRELFERWSRGLWPDEVGQEMKADQLASLQKLLAVIDRCIESDRAMVVS